MSYYSGLGWVSPFPRLFGHDAKHSFSGHMRPLVHLAARMVKLRPIVLTMITTHAFFDRVKTEFARSFDEGEDEYANRIRSVCISCFSSAFLPNHFAGLCLLEMSRSSGLTRQIKISLTCGRLSSRKTNSYARRLAYATRLSRSRRQSSWMCVAGIRCD